VKRAFAIGGLLAVLLAAVPALAQEAQELDLVVDDIDLSDYPEVVLTVTVPQEMNGLDLTPENFFVSEDSRGVGLDVEQLPAEELQVALLMDTSGSMQGAPIAAARAAVNGFIEAMPPDVELALIGFGDSSELLVPFTTDREEIRAGVDSLSASGETALYDGLRQAAASFGVGGAERRTIVLLTDGRDTVSEADLDDALVDLIGSRARLLIVELESPESDRTTLNRLEAATDGELVPATDPEALAGIYSEVASNLVNQYRLTFQSFAEGATDLLVAVQTVDFVAQATATAQFPVPPPVTQPPTTSTTSVAPTTTRAPVAVVAVPVEIEVPWVATTTGLMVGAAAVFVALALVFLLMVPSRRGASAALASLAALGRRDRGRMSELANKATMFAEDAITRGREGKLRFALDQAGLRLRDGEFLLIVFSVVLVAVVGGWLYLGPLWAALFASIVVVIAFAVLRWLGERRATAFRLQLPDSLQLISGSLRAGFGLNQAITAVAAEQDSPAREEFSRAQLEVHLGRDVEEALRNMAVRVQSEDLPWVAEAIEIHREVGGDIADLLDQIASTVRERERIRGQIQVLSAEGKISGLVLVALPFIIAGLTFSVAPDYLRELIDTTAGKVMLAGGSGAMLVGIFWIRRIVRLEF